MSENIQVPKGWEVKKLGEVFKESRILGSKGDKAKKITLKLWGKGVVEKKEYIEGSATTQYYIRKEGQFIYSKLDFLNQAFAIIPKEYDGYETTIDLPCFDIDTSINPIFILEYIKQPSIYINYGKLFANGGRKARRVQVADFLNMPIPVPPLEEQKKIAEILSLWDKAIEQKKELIAYKEKQKKGLMQALLTGKKRLNGFTDEWKTVKLGECFKFFRGEGLSKEMLDNNGKNYCILYGELYTTYSEVISDIVSKTNYTTSMLSKNGDVLIPCSTTTKAIDLATASSIKLDNILIGGDINILRPTIEINSDFIAYYITNIIKKKIATYAQGTTIIHLYGKDIKSIKIKIPTINEQNLIINIIKNADKEIELLNKQLELYIVQKKGLMQNLLTGKVRV